MTYDGETLRFYYDGDLIDSEIIALNTGSHDIYFGRWRDNYFDGKIDEVRFWDISLDSNQIRENIYHTLTGHEPHLIGYWQFNDSAGTLLSDLVDGNAGELTNMDNDDWIISTAPVPYATSSNGTWESDATWLTGQNTPVNSWARARIEHAVTINSTIEIIELKIDPSGEVLITNGNQLNVSGP
jgi:hypothetical protein